MAVGAVAQVESQVGQVTRALRQALGGEARAQPAEVAPQAPNKEVVEILARSALPRDHSRVVRVQLARLSWFFGGYRPVEEIGDARRNLLKVEDWKFPNLMELLATDDYCSEEVLTELARTPSMRKRMERHGLIPESSRHRSRFDRSQPARGREMLARFGVQVPKPKKVAVALPPVVRIGGWGRGGRELRLGRAELFERVWTVPVETLAKEWGLSGRGLAKACRRLRIPVPPRGHWAKVAAGQRVRRPKLPTLPSGQGEEAITRVP